MVEEILRDAIPIDEPFEYKGKLIQTYEIPISLYTRWAESCKYCCFNYNGICKFFPHPYRYFYKELIVMERKIGEIFEYNGEWYQCVEDSSDRCINCCFYNGGHKKCNDKIGECFKGRRSDNHGVYFKKLEKVGEPFACRNMSLGCYGIIVQRYKVFAEPILTDNSIKWCDSTNETILIALINKQDMEEKNNGNTPLNVLTDKYVNGDICYDDFEKEVKALYSCKEEIKPTLKDFDLEAAKQGKPVCTRDGCKARIICFDAKGKQPIIALLEREKTDEEIIQTYSMNGRYYEFRKEDHRDLMMLPEKKEGWAKVRKDINLYDTKEEADRKMIGNDEYVTAKVCWEE